MTAHCQLTVRLQSGLVVSLAVTIDTAPQAYYRLERTAIEAGQQFTPVRLVAAPQNVKGLGLDADWFPDERQLMTTDGTRLITVAVNWPTATQARERALAVTAARPFLGPLRPQAAVPNGS